MKNTDNKNVRWVIDFQNNKPIQIKKYPKTRKESLIDITVDFSEGRARRRPPNQKNSLNKIEQTCKDIRQKCQETLTHELKSSNDEEIEYLAQNLNNLYSLVVELILLFTRFNPPKDKSPGKPDEE